MKPKIVVDFKLCAQSDHRRSKLHVKELLYSETAVVAGCPSTPLVQFTWIVSGTVPAIEWRYGSIMHLSNGTVYPPTDTVPRTIQVIKTNSIQNESTGTVTATATSEHSASAKVVCSAV